MSIQLFIKGLIVSTQCCVPNPLNQSCCLRISQFVVETENEAWKALVLKDSSVTGVLERTACSALEKEHPQEVCVCGVTLCPDVSVCHEQPRIRRERKNVAS